MSGIIKNQILKQLSRYTKNLSANKINISALKGEGELHNLELNEESLMDLLDLPSWLTLTKAVCNRVNIKIQWTKLKSQPICLYIDEVEIIMETCPDLRKPSTAGSVATVNAAGKYGLVEKIIDGITVNINSVVVRFHAKAFSASFQMSRIVIRSKTPKWNLTDNLRHTRVKDDLRGEVLIFKEAEWLSLRIEANALEGAEGGLLTTPLRLISNQAKVRITIKKKLNDCSIVASSVSVLLDDLLWVLTDSQLKAALIFVNSVHDIIKKANLQSKHLAAEKLKKQGLLPSSNQSAQSVQKPASKIPTPREALFIEHNLIETSYHLYTGRVDLHLCDDTAPAEHELANYKQDKSMKHKVDGGALQITLHKLAFDYYPFHLTGTSRSHWVHYDMDQCEKWCQSLINSFKTDVRKVRDFLTMSSAADKTDLPSTVSSESLSQQRNNIAVSTSATNLPNSSPSQRTKSTNPTDSGMKMSLSLHGLSHQQSLASRAAHLLQSSIVLRLEDFAIYRVSTASDARRNKPRKFFASDKLFHHLPKEQYALHVEFTDYYFPEGIDYPVPPTAIYMELNPVKLVIDYMTISWLNVFLLNLWANVDMQVYSGVVLPESETIPYHADIMITALMPRVILPAEDDALPPCHPSYPRALQIHLSKLTFTNCRANETLCSDLQSTLSKLASGALYGTANQTQEFPNFDNDLNLLPPHFEAFINHCDGAYFDKTVERILFKNSAGEASNLTRANSDEVIIAKEVRETTSLNSPKHQQSSMAMSEYGLTYHSLRTNSFKTDSNKDVWCVSIEQLWLTFITPGNIKNSRPVPFVESFPLVAWLISPWALPLTAINGKENSMDHSPQENQAKQDSWDPLLANSVVTPNNCDSRQSIHSLPKNAQFHVLIKFGSKVNVQLNHYQFTFLMRLVDALVKCQKEVIADMESIEKKQNITKGPIDVQKVNDLPSFGISFILEECELAMIFPPLPADVPSQLPSRDFKDDPINEQKDDSTSGSDPITRESTIHDLNAQMNGEDNSELNVLHSGVLMRSASESQLNSLPSSHIPLTEPLLHSHETKLNGRQVVIDAPVDIRVSSTALTGSYPSIGGEPVTNSGLRNPIHSTSDTMLLSRSLTDNKLMSPGIPSVMPSKHSEHNLEKEGDIKKSLSGVFSKGVSRIVGKSKQFKRDFLEVHDDEDDSMSLKSGLSSDEDDEGFQLLQHEEQEAPAFESKRDRSDDGSSAICSDTIDDDLESVNTYNSEKAHTIVSVVTFKLAKIEVSVQGQGDNMAALVVVDRVVPNELGNYSLDKFQAEFANDALDTASRPPLSTVPIRLRFQVGPEAEKFAKGAAERGYLMLRVQQLQLQMLASSMENISELFRDTVTSEAMPMHINLHNIDVTLKDDKKPLYIGVASAEPVHIHLSSAVISRNYEGVFDIAAGVSSQDRELSLRTVSPPPPYSNNNQCIASVVPQEASPSAVPNLLSGPKSPIFQRTKSSSDVTSKQHINVSNGCTKELSEKEEDEKVNVMSNIWFKERDDMIEQMKEQADLIVAMKLERENLMRLIHELQDELYAAELNREAFAAVQQANRK